MSSAIRYSIVPGILLFAFPALAAAQDAEIHFNSACDFSALEVRIRQQQDDSAEHIALNVRLQPEARDRLAQVTRQHLNQQLITYINGAAVNTATIRSELNIEGLQIAVDKHTAEKLFPGLLNTHCQPAQAPPG